MKAPLSKAEESTTPKNRRRKGSRGGKTKRKQSLCNDNKNSKGFFPLHLERKSLRSLPPSFCVATRNASILLPFHAGPFFPLSFRSSRPHDVHSLHPLQPNVNQYQCKSTARLCYEFVECSLGIIIMTFKQIYYPLGKKHSNRSYFWWLLLLLLLLLL